MDKLNRISALYQLLLIPILVLTIVLISSTAVNCKNYYFSASIGNDTRTSAQAQNQSTPWKTIDKLNSFFPSLMPGDSVLFKRDEVFYGSIKVGKSGTSSLPIVIGAYGIGKIPIISGFQTITGWTNLGNNKWESAATDCSALLNMVTINNINTPIGRYPNIGYLIYESSVANTSITDLQLSNNPNWTGAEVVIRKRTWILDRNKITSHSGTTVSYITGSSNEPSANHGYFFQNDPKTLDIQGEWYFNPISKRLLMYFNNSPNSSIIKASFIDELLNISGFNYISVNNLSFEGANKKAISLNSAKYIEIKNCNIEYSGLIAINASGTSSFLKIDNCFINQTNDAAIKVFAGSDYAELTNNTIKNTGLIAGMGGSGTSTYSAILIEASNALVEYNTIESTGYIGIKYKNNNTIINKNYINYYCSVLDDGAAIYTSLNSIGSVISSNIIINGIGAKEGTPSIDELTRVAGIYLDDKTANVTVNNNTIANVSRALFIHNTHEVNASYNTFFNNGIGLSMVHDNHAPNDLIRNVTLQNNIFAPTASNQTLLDFNSILADVQLFGSANNNYFIRSVGDNFLGRFIYTDNGKRIQDAYSFNKWKLAHDVNAKPSPIPIPAYKISSLGPNKLTNGTFTTNISGTSQYYSGTAALTWDNTGKMDGGCAKLSYSKLSSTSNKANFMINIGNINAGKKYIVRFSTLGTNTENVASSCLYGAISPWPIISETQFVGFSKTRTNHELLFTANTTVSAAQLYIIFSDLDGTAYIDNVEVFEANVTENNFDDILYFDFNATKAIKTVVLPGTYIDVRGVVYPNSITLQPYSSVVLFKTGASSNHVPSIQNQDFQLNENSSNGTIVGTVLASDPDPGQSKSFSFVSGNTNNAFSINSTTGVITVANSIALNFEVTPAFAVIVKVQDNGTPSLSSQATITVSLKDINESPVINNQTLTIVEKAPNGTTVGSIVANDPDAGQTLTYSILSGNTNNAFSINTSTGVLKVATSNSLNYQITPLFTLVIKVQDNGAGNLSSQSTITVNLTSANACSATGKITYQVWNNIGTSVSVSSLTGNINYPNSPSSTTLITSMEGTTDLADGFGARIAGYICAPSTGSYTFWIASDDNGELWLSTNDKSINKQKIAYVTGYTSSRQWDKYTTQKSVSIDLVQGQTYYIEALMKDATGGDNLAVGWLKPGQTGNVPSEVIPGSVLSPLESSVSVPVSSISLPPTSSVNVGSNVLILSTVLPSNASNNFLNWTSSNPAIAKVDNNGFVTGISAGIVTITARSTDGSNKSDNCLITVTSQTCSATGNITYQVWNNIGNSTSVSSLTSNLNYPDNPSSTTLITSMEGTTNLADGFGAKIAGYICAPATGSYTFWIASDDYGELWLSTDSEPANKQKIAYHNGYTWIREWNKYPTQKSVTINLIQGQTYYIEALMKDAGGGDNLAVGWLKPGQTGTVPSEVIPGTVLSPISSARAPIACSAVGNISYEIWNDIGNGVAVTDLTTNINYPNNPTSSVLITSMEGASNQFDNYGARISGYICAPTTGSYTFWIASDDYGELWLSTDDLPANEQKIAYVIGYTASRQWDKYATQKSVQISLVQGQRYYIKALKKDAAGGDNLAVGWLRPGQTGIVPSEIVPGSVLSPLETTKSKQATSFANTTLSESDISLLVYPNPLNSDVLNVKLENILSEATIKIYSIAGVLCYDELVSDTETIHIDRSVFKSGIYIVKAYNNDFVKTIKLIVK